ncbi:fad-linked oxidoreductase [Bipolaris maydis]|nr:fad-linked oxidoreductase [Bipolaris maydis]
MTELVETQSITRGWRNSRLPSYLAGDVSAAFLSATLISPILTAIDRAVVENVSSTTRPLSTALKENLLCTIRYPKSFFAAKPFIYMWMLYAATYTTANSMNTLTSISMNKSPEFLANSLIFIATCTVNVPLGVCKDICFVQTFGGRPPGPANTPQTKPPLPPRSPTKFPKAVAATFLARDAITILGSFTLPPMLTHRIPIADPAAQMAVAQLLMPVLSQLAATPVRWHTGVIPPTRSVGAHTGMSNDTKTISRTTKVLPREVAASDAPLAKMPLQMFLRSFSIATISSKRYLLIPSLKLLSFFAKPGRSYLFNVDRNPVLHGILKKTFYNQFCAGESKQETKACCKSLKDLGFKGTILTYAKEMVFDHKSKASSFHAEQAAKAETVSAHDPVIEEWRVGTLATVDMIDKGDILALKTTGGGPAVGEAFHRGELPPQQMMDALDEIETRCKERGIQIIVDAESQYFQKGIARTSLELMRKFNREPKVVIYNTYQAYLKNQPRYLQQHLAEAEKDGFTLGLKLVRGAYISSDDRSVIHNTKEDTNAAYNGIMEGALQQKLWDFGVSRPFPALNLLLASHNKKSVITAQRLHVQREKSGLPTVPVAFAQLHGMSDEVGFSLLKEQCADGKAPDVFKCSTWGSMGDCVAYLLQRAVENRDAVLRTKDEFDALKKEFWRRMGLRRV